MENHETKENVSTITQSKEEFSKTLLETYNQCELHVENDEIRRNIEGFIQQLTLQNLYTIEITTPDHIVRYTPQITEPSFDDILKELPAQNIEVTEPVLKIENLQQFLNKTAEFLYAVQSSAKDVGVWGDNAGFFSTERVWYNATPWDFDHPIEFIDKYTQMIRGGGLVEVLKAPRTLIELPERDFDIVMKTSPQHVDYETPFAFVPGATLEKGKSNSTYDFCIVRIGTYEKNGKRIGVLYGTQNNEHVKEARKQAENDIESSQKMIQDFTTLYRTLHSENPEEFENIFGPMPVRIFDLEDETEFYINMREQLLQNMRKKFPELDNDTEKYDKYVENLLNKFPKYKNTSSENYETTELGNDSDYDYKEDFTFARGIGELNILFVNAAREIEFAEEALAIADRKDAIYKTLMRGLKTDTPPNHIAGLVTTFAMLQNLGIAEIEIPLYLPIRVEKHRRGRGEEEGDNINSRKMNNLANSIAFISTKCAGVEVEQNTEPYEDGFSYARIKLSNMSSENTLLNELINAGKTAAENTKH